MNTDHPTVEMYFVVAHAYCKLRVYTPELEFMKEVLMEHRVEFFEHKGEECKVIDTRVQASLIRAALPKILERKLQKGLPALLAI